MSGDPRYQRRGYAPRPAHVPNGAEYGMPPPPPPYNRADVYGPGPQEIPESYNYRGTAYGSPGMEQQGVGYHPSAMGPGYGAFPMAGSVYGGHDVGAMYASGRMGNMGGVPAHDPYTGPMHMYGAGGMPRGYPVNGRVGMHGLDRADGRLSPGYYPGAVTDRNGYGRGQQRWRGRGRWRGRAGDREQGREMGDVVCCYFLRGICQHGPRCCFSHEDHGQPCRFGSHCRHGHEQRGHKGNTTAPETDNATASVCPETSNDPTTTA